MNIAFCDDQKNIFDELDKLIDKHLNNYKSANYESDDMIEDIQVGAGLR